MGLFGNRRAPYRVELRKASDGWRYRVLAKNNKVVGASEEALVRKDYTIKKVKGLYPGLPVYVVSPDSDPVEV